MKITFYCSKFPPLAGGAGIHAYYLGKDLSEEGHRISVVCERTPGLKKHEKLNDNYNIYRIGVPFLKNQGSGLYFIFLCLGIAFKGLKIILREKPDILHFHDTATGIAGLITKTIVRKKPSVFNFGGSMTYEYMCNAYSENGWSPVLGENYAWENPKGIAKLLFKVEKNFYLKNDRVYAVAQYQTDMLNRHFGLQSPKVRTIHNGIDTGFLKRENFKNIKSELGYKRMIYVGVRLVKYKGLDILIKACLLILAKYDAYLVIAGEGPEEDKLKNLAGNNSRIKFLGNLSWEKNLQYVRSADLFVLPTLVDKTPNCLMEALSLETPCISSDIDGVKELVPSGCGILIKPNDPEILREKIEWVFQHSDEAAEMGSKARKFMVEQFDWKKTFEKVKVIYNELLNSY